jgi:hypothetical protein
MLPASEDINDLFADEFDNSLKGIDPDRALLYKICEQNNVGITVMKALQEADCLMKEIAVWCWPFCKPVHPLCTDQTCSFIDPVRL